MLFRSIANGLSGARKKGMCARNVEICQNEGNDESCGHALLERNVFPGADAVKEKIHFGQAAEAGRNI